MKTISIANLKGGVGKTITSINLAYLLAAEHEKRVLIVDNDKQGNVSQFFGRYGYEHAGTGEVMTREYKTPEDVIQHTENPNIDIIAANLSLADAERQVQNEAGGLPQQLRLKMLLLQVRDRYDFCIIDNAPSIGMCVINALAASDFLIVPVKIDRFTFEGLDSLLEQAGEMHVYFNKRLRLLGTLITSYRKNASNVSGEEWLRQAEKYHVFNQHISYSDKVDESTFSQEPITVYSKTCGTSWDYRAWTAEVLVKMAAAEGGKDDE